MARHHERDEPGSVLELKCWLVLLYSKEVHRTGQGQFLNFVRRGEFALAIAIELAGQDNNGTVWSICKMNMILHNVLDADIQLGDTIEAPQHIEGVL